MDKNKAINLIKKEFHVEIINKENIPAFGATLIPDDPEKDQPIIALNVGTCLICSIEEDTDFKEIVMQTLMHEFGHVVESWLGLEVSEERIERLILAYQEKYGTKES